jgi:hypothetical protein
MAVNYQVKQGDCIFSIAFEHGFFADTIWNHPNNEDLKEKRKDPNVLMPGDTVYVPDKRPREYSEATNQVYKYRCKNTPKTFQIQFKYLDTPIKNIDYKLTIDGKEFDGKTDGEGWLKQSILPNAKLAKVTFADGTEYDLKLGDLDPVEEIFGVQQRLGVLGLYSGNCGGKLDDETKASIKVFQFTNDLEISGEADEKTKSLLEKLVGK